jgi:hypothetical protein
MRAKVGHHPAASHSTSDGSDQLLSGLVYFQHDVCNLVHRAAVSILLENLGSQSPSRAPEAGHLVSRAPFQRRIAGKVHEPILAMVRSCIYNLNSSLHTVYRPAFRPSTASCNPGRPYMSGMFFFVWCQPP